LNNYRYCYRIGIEDPGPPRVEFEASMLYAVKKIVISFYKAQY